MKLIPDMSTFLNKGKERNAEPKSSVHSLELVITMILFILVGRFIDSRFDTTPIWTLIFTFIGIFGSFASAFYRYREVSERLEKDKVWATKKQRVDAPVEEQLSDGIVVPTGYGQDD